MDDLEILDSWVDMDQRVIKVGDKVLHVRTGIGGVITSLVRDRGKVVVWVNHDEDWMPYHVRIIS